MQRLVNFVSRSARLQGWTFRQDGQSQWVLMKTGEPNAVFTTDRDAALHEDSLQLMGMEHPIVHQWMRQYAALPAGQRAIAGKMDGIVGEGVLTFWKVSTRAKDGQTGHHIVRIAMNPDGDRAPWLERLGDKLLALQSPSKPVETWQAMANGKKSRFLELLHRDLSYRGIINEDMSYAATPLAVVGIEN